MREDPRRLVRFWLIFWALGGVFFYLMNRHDVALCRATRYVFRTHQPAGRATFTIAFGAGAVWLWRHIIR